MKKLNEAILNHVKKNGGATLKDDLNHADLKEGYMVSFKDYEMILDEKEVLEKDVTEFTEKAKALGGYVGLWMDAGKVFLDISTNIKDKHKAIKKGLEEKQLAIYDIKNDKVIDL